MPRDRSTPRAPLRALGRLAPLALAALLAACAPMLEKGESPRALDERFAGQALIADHQSDASAAELGTWWRGFDDAALTALVQRALDQNLDLAIALARVDQARAAAQGAGAARLPQVTAQGQLVRQRQSLKSPEGALAHGFPGYERDQTLQTLGLGASWEADLAGGLRQGESAAVAEWQAAEAARLGTRVTVVAEVADAYFRIRGAQARIDVAEAHLRNQSQLLRLIQDRFAGGLAAQREVAEAQALQLQARGTLPPLRTELAQQLHRLDVLMGEQAGTAAMKLLADTPASPRAGTATTATTATTAAPAATIGTAGVGASTYRVPSLPGDLTPATLMRRRPDVIAAERQLDASQARIGVATAEYYPRLTLGGVLGASSLSGGLLSSAAFQPQALLGLHWRLFDFGRVDAEVAQARGARAEALGQVRQRMLRATEDVENAIVTLSELELQRGDLAQEVRAHQVARDAAEDAYKGGAASLIEVLQEDRLLLAARDQLAQLDANHARAAVSAFRAFGGGWEDSPAR
ncbi:TolC family protein [Mitsuaria sp. GD03876]|uniref:TolC family protein n=1 Tax=Mitsuaria sp. GD03876 TaxID=2975399 RepID=UPI00244A7259|nr:TolC family protein [Mitsuaria sp. GD03876]MDH0864711.1 TolC family protein [Mitsuaria sp. GD03876]